MSFVFDFLSIFFLKLINNGFELYIRQNLIYSTTSHLVEVIIAFYNFIEVAPAHFIHNCGISLSRFLAGIGGTSKWVGLYILLIFVQCSVVDEDVTHCFFLAPGAGTIVIRRIRHYGCLIMCRKIHRIPIKYTYCLRSLMHRQLW